MQLPPVAVTSQRPPPNYVGPEVQGPALPVVGILLSSLATLIVGLRVFTRLTVSKFYGIDDALIVLAALLTISHTTIVILCDLRFGGDRHIWDVPLQDIVIGRKLDMAVTIVFAAACTMTKMSMVFFTRRILSSASRMYRLIITTTILVIATEGLTCCFIVLFQCSPIDQYWTLMKTSNCINERSNLLAASIINTITDFIVVLIPIPTIWDLQMPTRQRIAVVSLFAVGLIASSASIARTIYTYRFTSTWDSMWEACPTWISSTVELDLGIICASVPAIKPLLARYFPTASDYSSTLAETSMPTHQSVREAFYLKDFGGHPSATVTCRCDNSDGKSQKGIVPNSSANL